MTGEFKKSFQEKLTAFQNFAIDVVFDRRHGRRAMTFGFFLKMLSYLFSGLVQIRLYLYKNRIFRSTHLGCQVIVVGNLTVGGTGKTPVVEKLARSLRDRGRKVAILSRGYRSKKEPFFKKWIRAISHAESPPPRVVSDGEKIYLTSETAGDEPYMLAKNLPGVFVIVDKDRVKAGQYAIKKFGADIIILDDGFQYLSLAEHQHLLLIDKNNPFGNSNLLPRGVLREPIRHLRRASYVFLTKSNGNPDKDLENLIQQHKPGIEIIECTHAAQYLKAVHGRDVLPLNTLKGKRIAAFSAIAVPEGFENILREHGAEIRFRRRFIDHHRFHEWELEELSRTAREAELDMLLTTEKDSVRIDPDFNPGVPFYFLRVEIKILSGAKDFDEAVNRVCFPKKKMTATRKPFAVITPTEVFGKAENPGQDDKIITG